MYTRIKVKDKKKSKIANLRKTLTVKGNEQKQKHKKNKTPILKRDRVKGKERKKYTYKNAIRKKC